MHGIIPQVLRAPGGDSAPCARESYTIAICASLRHPEPVAHVPLTQALAYIQGRQDLPQLPSAAELRQMTERLRAQTDRAAYDMLKRTLPACVPAGRFARRAKDGWQEANGLVAYDLDALEPERLQHIREQALTHPAVALAKRSPSGKGLHVLLAVDPAVLLREGRPDPERYRRAWHAGARIIRSWGVEPDQQASDCARALLLCHDDDAGPATLEALQPLTAADVDALEQEAAREAQQALPHARPEPPAQADGVLGDEEARLRLACAAYDLLMHGPDSISGQRGHDGCLAAMRRLVDGHALRGLVPLKQLLQVAQAWNACHARPRWTDDELQHKLQAVLDSPPSLPPGWRQGTAAPPDELPQEVWHPAWLREDCEVLAATYQVTPAIPLLWALSLASLAVGTGVRVQSNKDPDAVAIWGLAVAPSCAGKNSIQAALLAPLEEAHQATRRGLLAEIPRERHREARLPCLYTSDATPEAWRLQACLNGGVIGYVTPELQLRNLLGAQYDRAGSTNLQPLLDGYSGGHYAELRIERGGQQGRAQLVVVVGCQPSVAQELAALPEVRQRGLFGRLLCVWQPEVPPRPYDTPRCALQQWPQQVRELYRLGWSHFAMEAGQVVVQEHQPRCMGLNQAARQLHRDYHDACERQRASTPEGPMAHVLGRGAQRAARIAAVFALLQDPRAQEVDAKAMRAAIAFDAYCTAHARALFEELDAADALDLPKRLYAKVKKQSDLPLSKLRDAFRQVLDARFDGALQALQCAGLVRVYETHPGPQGGRQGQRVCLAKPSR